MKKKKRRKKKLNKEMFNDFIFKYKFNKYINKANKI